MAKTELQTFVVEKIGRRLNCKCGNEWWYCGKNAFYAQCTKCRSTVTISPKRKKNNEGAA
jgi:hypothetical protein